ncbi:single-stranded DNA-binding protein [Sphaerisporangium sp. TRM90804]|uniref:single-stranded DNA-binding protein n=1 Tax=Sphaerisporangium sp. TRM90804 TaxID=3031113 RepID=UPI00244A0114|nr:single-stranded DNA-binding protein [Sphaerisporangium sp. TRM90804]MDH2430306.1 single-stranded DNA-binding protein [Sphaerisporangium sp. TRM90804]
MHRNEVTLVGRVSRPPAGKELPSGDHMISWGLAVRRPSGHPSGKKADGIACVAFDPEVNALVAQWLVDDVVSVEGALHQRFRATRGAGASTYEVEVHRAERLLPGRRTPRAATVDQPAGPDSEEAGPRDAGHRQASQEPGREDGGPVAGPGDMAGAGRGVPGVPA